MELNRPIKPQFLKMNKKRMENQMGKYRYQ